MKLRPKKKKNPNKKLWFFKTFFCKGKLNLASKRC